MTAHDAPEFKKIGHGTIGALRAPAGQHRVLSEADYRRLLATAA